MTAKLLYELLCQGLQLWAEGDELRYRTARGALTPELRRQLAESKSAIRELIGQRRKYALPSFAQQRLWFLDQVLPGSPFYTMPLGLRLSGQLDVAALERSLNALAARHETLRTTFTVLASQPVQVIAAPTPLPLRQVDLRSLPAAEREAEAQRLAKMEALQPFDLERGPLMRAALLRLDEAEHLLVMTMHHILSDDWSTGVLFRDLAALYAAFLADAPAPLPDLPIQYADYALWQRGWLQGPVAENQLNYWRDQLATMPSLLELACDRPRPPVQSFQGRHHTFHMPAGISRAVAEFSRQQGVTLFTTLLAAWQALLHAYAAARTDIPVGSLIANRNRAETEGLIGFFANTVVLRGDLSGDPTFRTLLARVRDVVLGAYAHQELPFEKVLELLKPERDPSHTPLIQVMFVLENAHGELPSWPGLTMTPAPLESDTARFDLLLFMVESAAGLSGSLEYATDLFDAATVERMIDHFQGVLERGIAKPDLRLSELLAPVVVRHSTTTARAASAGPSSTAPKVAAPETPLEQAIAALMAEVLGRDQIGVRANFFALGGDSLRATQVLLRLQDEFQVDLSLPRLLQEPSAAGLALAILEAQIDSTSTHAEDDILSELEDLSDEEAERLLSQYDGNGLHLGPTPFT